ncbi:MAG: peptidylprolyl isomerase [Bradymonadia bacterium]
MNKLWENRLLRMVFTYALCFVGLLTGACSSKVSGDCVSVGEAFGEPINATVFVEEFLASYGSKFGHEFIRRKAVERRVETMGIKLPDGLLESEFKIAERDFFASHSGEIAAEKHLKTYGLTLADWRRLTRVRLRHTLLSRKLMAAQPSERMLTELFEKRYGKNGERRELRYLYVSTQADRQTVLTGDELKKALTDYQEKGKAILASGLKVSKTSLQTRLDSELSAYNFEFRRDVQRNELPLNILKKYDAVPVGQWSEIYEDNNHIGVIRGVPEQTRVSKNVLRFEQILVDVSQKGLLEKGMASVVKARAKQRAETLFRQINQQPKKFGLVAKTKSNHASRSRGGRFPIFQPENAGLSKKSTESALNLKTAGQLIMVEDAVGFHLLRLESLTRVDRAKVTEQLLQEMSRRSYSDTEVVAFVDDLVADANLKLSLKLAKQCRAKGK